MSIYQHPIPFCIRCGAIHNRLIGYTYSQYCQKCEDQTVMEAFFNRRSSFGKTEQEQIEYIKSKRPDLIERGALEHWNKLQEAERNKPRPERKR